MTGPVQRTRPDYSIRRYERGDRADVLALHETVFGVELAPDTFDWRYDDPYLDRVPIVVADAGDAVVGALALLPSYVRTGGEHALALQPVNAMVHPDHRRQGLYSRIVETALDDYADGEPELLFNFPSPAAKAAHLDLGWREVGRQPVWYRVQRPTSLLEGERAGALEAALNGAGRGVAAATQRVGDLLSAGPDRIDVRRHESVPAASLETAYETAVPDALHVHRDERFYRWRFGNPEWDVAAYVARRGGDPVGAVVAVTAAVDGEEQTELVESLPLADSAARPAVFARLLSAVVRDHRGSAVLRAADSTAPDRVLARYGFVRDDLPLISRVTSPTAMVARPFDADDPSAWRLGRYRVDRDDDWCLSLGDQDVVF